MKSERLNKKKGFFDITFINCSNFNSAADNCEFFGSQGLFYYRIHPNYLHAAGKEDRKAPLLPVLAGALIIIPLLFVAGCTGQGTEPGLSGTGWTLTGYFQNGTPGLVPTTTKVTMDFGNEGQITGSAGCNHYFASYELKGTAISIGQAGSTVMYCSDPGVMDQENAFLTLLGQARSITVEGDWLTLSDAKGTTILTFTKTVPPAQETLVGTNWKLESFHTADSVSSVIAGTTINAVFGEDGKVSGSAGCNRYFATYNMTGSSLSTGTVGSTKMYCGEPGVMVQENKYLALLGKVKTFTIEGGRLSLKDEKGTHDPVV